jgi:hypothetical protein
MAAGYMVRGLTSRQIEPARTGHEPAMQPAKRDGWRCLNAHNLIEFIYQPNRPPTRRLFHGAISDSEHYWPNRDRQFRSRLLFYSALMPAPKPSLHTSRNSKNPGWPILWSGCAIRLPSSKNSAGLEPSIWKRNNNHVLDKEFFYE